MSPSPRRFETFFNILHFYGEGLCHCILVSFHCIEMFQVKVLGFKEICVLYNISILRCFLNYELQFGLHVVSVL